MKGRWLLLSQLVVLLTAGLVTWWVYQPAREADPGERILLDLKADQVERLEYKTDKLQVIAEAMPKGGYLLTIQQTLSKRVAKKVPAKPEDGSPDGGPADGADAAEPEMKQPATPPDEPEVREETKISRYRASPDFEKALARVLPLVAVRELGEVDPEKLTRFGLAEPAGELSVTSRGQTVRYHVGERTYGRASVYLRPAPAGPVSLVSAGVLSTVDFRPPRFKELRFLGLPPDEVDQLVIDCDATGSRTLLHHNRLQPGGGLWGPADDPNASDDLFRNWMTKLLKLSLVDYLSEPVEPNPGAHCKLVFQRDGAEAMQAEITWSADPSGKQVYHGRSEFSGGWVKLEPTAAGSLVSDLSSILDQGDAPRPPAAP